MAGVSRNECRSRLSAQAGIQADVAGVVRAAAALNDLISPASPARLRTLVLKKHRDRRRNNLAHSSHHGLGCCLVAIGLLATANAQDYPARPIKIVVGFGPGGLGDITARAVAQKMSDSLWQPVG